MFSLFMDGIYIQLKYNFCKSIFFSLWFNQLVEALPNFVRFEQKISLFGVSDSFCISWLNTMNFPMRVWTVLYFIQLQYPSQNAI